MVKSHAAHHKVPAEVCCTILILFLGMICPP